MTLNTNVQMSILQEDDLTSEVIYLGRQLRELLNRIEDYINE